MTTNQDRDATRLPCDHFRQRLNEWIDADFDETVPDASAENLPADLNCHLDQCNSCQCFLETWLHLRAEFDEASQSMPMNVNPPATAASMLRPQRLATLATAAAMLLMVLPTPTLWREVGDSRFSTATEQSGIVSTATGTIPSESTPGNASVSSIALWEVDWSSGAWPDQVSTATRPAINQLVAGVSPIGQTIRGVVRVISQGPNHGDSVSSSGGTPLPSDASFRESRTKRDAVGGPALRWPSEVIPSGIRSCNSGLV